MVDVSAPNGNQFFLQNSSTAAPRVNAACEASHALWTDLGLDPHETLNGRHPEAFLHF